MKRDTLKQRGFWLASLVAVAIAGLVAVGCNRLDNPAAPTQAGPSDTRGRLSGPAATSVTTSNLLSGYLVQFDGRVFAGGQTTFSYTVSGTGVGGPMSQFFLELPGCAPALASATPSDGTVGVNPLVDIFGVRFHDILEPDESRAYSITFPGDVPLGVIRAFVHAGEVREIGEIAGPCDGFEISGTVYVDADSNGVQSGIESGIPGVTVTLVGGTVETTDANGDYSFLKIAGTYTVRIDAATAATDFNEDLASSFDPTGSTSFSVTVGPDAPGTDFGYNPQQEEIIIQLETGVLPTDGKPVKFWKRQLRGAIAGSTRNEFTASDMAEFLTEIEGLFIPDPFQFTPGSEFEEALAILNIRSNDPVQQLIRELLTAELNEVSGKGLVGEDELQRALLAWAEAVAAEASASAVAQPTSSRVDRPQAAAGSTTTVRDAINVLILVNGATAGGSGGGG
jgi:hypothetical protein